MKQELLNHFVYRAYIALARGEHYTTSELGDAPHDDAELEGEFYAQLNWTESKDMSDLLRKAWGLSEEQWHRMKAFQRPSAVQNVLYSSRLQRVVGVSRLATVPGFTRFGLFHTDRRYGFYVARYDKNLIESLGFYNAKGKQLL